MQLDGDIVGEPRQAPVITGLVDTVLRKAGEDALGNLRP